MNKKLLVFTGISIALISFVIINFSFPLGFDYEPTQMYIDPKLAEVWKPGFALSTSNVNVIGIYVLEEQNGIFLQLEDESVGFISMDNPLPILQKLFPDADKTSFIILADGEEIEFILKDQSLQFDVNNNNKITIIGF